MYEQINRFRQYLEQVVAEFRKPVEAPKLEAQQDAMEEFARSRSISTVYHFTPVQNLPGICRHGILSRDQVAALGDSNFVPTDVWRTDGATWAICCSIEWTNYKMLYKKGLYYDLTFAVIALDAAVLWELDCIFLPGNAARADLRGHIPYLRGQRFQRLDHLRSLYPDPDTRKPLWQCFPEDPQAEVLVSETPISLKYVDYIYFNSKDAFNIARTLPWPRHIKCEVYPKIFGARPDQAR